MAQSNVADMVWLMMGVSGIGIRDHMHADMTQYWYTVFGTVHDVVGVEVHGLIRAAH